MRMERELTEKEKKERVLYRFTRPATSVRRLWERCHLRVLIHDGIILFQGNFWAFLRGAALMRSSNLRSSSNPDFRFVPRRRRSAPENYFPQYRRLSRSSRACLSSFFLPPLPSPLALLILFPRIAISKRKRSRKRENEKFFKIFF